MIRSLVPFSSSASSSESSPPRRFSGQYGSGPSVPASERLLPAVEEEPIVNQPGFPRPHPDDAAMLALDQPTVEEENPLCLEPAPSEIIVVGEPAMERLDSSPHELDSLALVVMDEPAMERPIPHRVLTTGFGERHQRRLYETIELSDTSGQGASGRG